MKMMPLLRLSLARVAVSGFVVGVVAGGACVAVGVGLVAALSRSDTDLPERFGGFSSAAGTAAALIAVGSVIGWLVRGFFASKSVSAAAEPRAAQDEGKSDQSPGGAATERAGTRADESARLSEERFARFVEASAAGHWGRNMVTGEFFLSQRARVLLDLPSDSQFADQTQLAARIPFHPDDRQRIVDVVANALDRGTDRYDVDFRVVTRSGDARWLRAVGKIDRDATGVPLQLTETLIEISVRKMAQEELQRSESRFRSLTELLSDWYWRQDEELRFTYLSSQANDLTGYSGESSIGKKRWELVNLLPLSGSWTEHQAVLAARQPFRELECCRIGPDGVPRYLSMTGAPIFDEEGRFKGYHGIGRNITERKRIEKETQAQQELLELAQKAARAVAFEWRIGDSAGPVRAPSRDLEAMLGLAPGSCDGTYESWKKLVHPDDAAAVDAAMARAAVTGDVTLEYRLSQAQSMGRWLQLKGRMSGEDGSEGTRLVGFMFDVTERHEAEEGLRRLEKQLRQAQRLEAMGTLAGGIAHDFNNILGAVLGYGERALRDAPKGGRQRRDLERVMTAGERGRALVEQILAFSRSATSERVAVHVERVVAEALDHLATRVPANVTVIPRLRSGNAAVLGDTTQVHQVLMNLANNAIQALQAGGTLSVSLDSVLIDATRVVSTGTIESGDYVVLEVADSGIGMPPEIVDRIFDPFFTTKEVGVGTGLGLSLVHGIVAELGGAISVASESGAGSVFTVYLPRAGEAPAADETEAPDLPHGDRERVLVLDDEEPLMRIATETLEELGYRPIGFTSSTAALEAFRREPQGFDLVLTDERMPGITGSALIREMRALRPRMPIVLMSGYVTAAALSAAREKGADEVLKKPLLRRDLAEALARVAQRLRFDAS